MKLSKADKYILYSILLIATVLRLWNLPNIPFTYDEFSALFLIRFDNFHNLIAYGGITDGHSVGVHFFLYYWTKIVGFSEAWVKVPFILMGIASVYFIFRVAWDWFGRSTAFLAASAMAFMQFPIMYSQIASSFGSGLFFTLFMVFFWSRMLFQSEKKYWWNFAGFVFGAGLCAYNHHFSLLMVLIVGISGLFFVRGKFLLRYLLAALLIIILYLPCLEIFLFQLSLGGGDPSINMPTLAFFKEYMRYLFHFSWPLYIGSLLILHVGYIRGAVFRKHKWNKFFTLVLIWAVLPSLIGYVYSITVVSVLQFSVLIFSFPFLLLFLFAFFSLENRKLTNILVLVFSSGLILTLIFQRQHYKMFYNSPFQQGFAQVEEFAEDHSDDSTLVVYTMREEIAEYYKGKYNLYNNQYFINYDSLNDIRALTEELQKDKYEYALLISIDPVLFMQVSAIYPNMLESEFYDQGSYFAFSKNGYSENHYYKSELNFEKEEYDAWVFDRAFVQYDSARSDSYFLVDSTAEFGPSLVLPFDSILQSGMDYPEACAFVWLPDSNVRADLVLSIERDASIVYSRTFEISLNTCPLRKWSPVSAALFMPDVYENIDHTFMKVYIWNKGGNFRVQKMTLGFRKGNPDLYWILKGRQN
ncbi:MAG: glycosyltransferase family 39 protein [Bacteroidales bacterium]|nr:glycosyltransferase family 39 protein [Bacteroidales bacterium]